MVWGYVKSHTKSMECISQYVLSFSNYEKIVVKNRARKWMHTKTSNTYFNWPNATIWNYKICRDHKRFLIINNVQKLMFHRGEIDLKTILWFPKSNIFYMSMISKLNLKEISQPKKTIISLSHPSWRSIFPIFYNTLWELNYPKDNSIPKKISRQW